MKVYEVVLADGSTMKVDADCYTFEADGNLAFWEEVGSMDAEDFHTVTQVIDEEEIEEDETAADLLDRLEVTFEEDLEMLLALSRVRAVMMQEDDE